MFNLSDVVIFISRTMLPFAPFPGRGFHHPELVLTPAGIAAALGIYPYVGFAGNLSPDDGVMDTVTGKQTGEVSYAIVPVSVSFDPDGSGPAAPVVTPLPVLFGVNSDVVSGLGNPFNPATSPLLPTGGTLTYTRRLIVSNRNDIAATSNLIFGGGPFPTGTLTGNIDADDNASVTANLIFTGTLSPIFGAAPVPITQVRTDANGAFSVTLPLGNYSVAITSPERNDLVVSLVVAPGTSQAVLPRLSATGRIRYSVTEKTRPIPAKLTFLGEDGTPTPNFSRYFDAIRFDPVTFQPRSNVDPSSFTGSPANNVVFTTSGSGTQMIKPGRYQIIASRGLEYTVARQSITVAAGQEVNANLELENVIDTRGFVSADFHIHSARSFDSSAPLADRVRSYVAGGVEVMVSTDHNFIIDLAPVVEELGVGSFVKTVVGNELTTGLPTPQFPQAFGHHNAFPVVVEPFEPRRGAVPTEYVNAATFYDRTRAKHPETEKVIQLNHPRAGVAGLTLIGLFNTIAFNPMMPVSGPLLQTSFLGTGTRNIDFDAIELYNGESVAQYLQVRNDWFSLLNQGFAKTATAVSDSHRVVVETPGMPLTYVASPTDAPSAVTDSMITSSVLAHNASGTSGPFIRFTIDNQPIGSLVQAKTGTKLEMIVEAPAWVPVEEVRIFANGQLFATYDATTHPTVTNGPDDPTAKQLTKRFNASVKVQPTRDTWFVVEAGARLPEAIDTNGDGVVDRSDTNGDGVINGDDTGIAQPPSPPIYQAVAPGFVPIAFTNPIWVDVDGNGHFDPPGLSTVSANSMKLTAVPPQPHGPDDLAILHRWTVGADEMRRFEKKMRELVRP